MAIRQALNTGVLETFTYDNLNRLSLYTVLGGAVSPPVSKVGWANALLAHHLCQPRMAFVHKPWNIVVGKKTLCPPYKLFMPPSSITLRCMRGYNPHTACSS
jgi:hypothetical protein